MASRASTEEPQPRDVRVVRRPGLLRWRFWKRSGLYRALLLVLILLIPDLQPIAQHEAERLALLSVQSASAAAVQPNRAPSQAVRHQAAAPSPSGADPPYPLNHTFDADPIDLGAPVPNHDFETPGYAVGAPPTNADFSAPPVDVGTPPANFDFSSGTFAGWTVTGTPTIQTSGGPDNDWTRLSAASQALVSSPFTVDATAQELVFDLGYLTTSNYAGVSVYLAAGPTYAFPSTAAKTLYCYACNRWETATVDLSPYLGQSIEVKFVYYAGVAGLDRVRVQQVLPGYAAVGAIERRTDASGAYAALIGFGAKLTSPAFTVDAAAQFGSVRLTALSTNAQAYVKVLSDPGYGTSTTVATVTSLSIGTWTTIRFNLSAYRGQSIKLKVEEAYASVGADDLGLQRVDFPNWEVTGTASLVPGAAGGQAIYGGSKLVSEAFALPADVQQLSLRYRVSDGGGTGVQVELLRGPSFATAVNLSVGYLSGAIGQWSTFTAAVALYAGETVKLRFTPLLQAVYLDDIGLLEKTVPGWSYASNGQAIAPGEDANGTYLAGWKGGRVDLLSSPVNLGVLQPVNGQATRSYVVSYAFDGSYGVVSVSWIPDVGMSYLLFRDDAPNQPVGFKNGRFSVYSWMGQHGHFEVYAANGGKIYSIADNVAKQQLAEPFSQQISLLPGSTIDSSTGSFGRTETDLAIAGGTTPITLTRAYAGHSDRHGEFGYRWSSAFDAYAAVYANGDVAIVFGSGREEYFVWNGNAAAFGPADPRITSALTKLPSGDYQYATKTKTTWNFAASGDLISVVDPNGNALTLYRDPATDLVASVADDAGRAITFTYDANGFLTEATTSAGATVEYAYDANGDLVAVDKLIAPGETPARTEYAYSRHRLIEIKERQGDATSNSMVTVLTATLDAVNRVVAETDALGHDLTIAYQTPAAGVTRVTDALNHVTDYYFDEWARTTAVIAPTGDIAQWLYDANGQLQSVIDPAGNGYSFAYNASADPTGITDPLNQTTSITWDAAKHLPTEIVDGRGAHTINSYDSAGNLLQTVVDASTDALGNPIAGTHLDLMTVYTVDAQGRRTSATVDPGVDAFGTTRSGSHLDLMTTYAYDSAGNVVTRIVDPAADVNGNPRSGTHLDVTTTWTYDGAGRVLTATDPNNHTTTYHYDTLGRLARITNALGQDVEFLINFQDQILGVRDPAGEITTWTYDAKGLVAAQADEEEFTTTYAYDDAGRELSATDPLGHATQTSYTADGKIATTTDALGGVTSYAYDAAGCLHTKTDPLGQVTTYDYDDNGRLIATTAPNGGVTTRTYDAAGSLTSVTDPLSHTTTYTYDHAGRLAQVTDPLGHATTNVYDVASRLVSSTNALSQTTAYAYDAAGRLTSITDPLGHVTTKTYDAAGNVASVTDPNGETTWYEYDAIDRLVETTDPLGRVSTTTYDLAGRVATQTTPEGRVTTSAYNPRGLLTSVTDNLGNVTSYAYDDAGRKISETNPRGYATAYAYDAAGNLTSVTDALGHSVAFAYDAAGRRTSVTDARGKMTSYTYDELGSVLTQTDPLGHVLTKTYDLAGRLATQTDARGILSQYGYDAVGQLTSILYPSGSIAYSYDAAGRQTQMTDPTGTTTWTYDAAGRTTNVADPNGAVAYGYDAAGNRASMTLPGGRAATYAYDAANQLTASTDWLSQTTAYGYDLDGNLTTVARPNGVNSLYGYDGAGRLTSIEHGDATSLLQRYVYTLDPNGNRTSVTTSGAATTPGVETYAFDALDRLTSATYPGGGSATYAYDAAGNRTSVTSGANVTTYTYDDAGELTSIAGPVGTVALTYDENGNRLTADGDSYSWTWDNQLQSADIGGDVVTFTYAGDGVRTMRAENSTSAAYLWDRAGGLPQLADDGATGYLHGPDGVSEEIAGSAATFDLPDALGSVRGRTDGGGAVTGTADYDVWGNLQASSGAQGSLGWTGELRDATTGFTDLRARDYAPGIGQFLSRDTLPNAAGTQGWNAYAYANGNPVTLTDPSGHSAEGAAAAVALALEFLGLVEGGGIPLVPVLVVLTFLVLALILALILADFDWQQSATHFASRAADAAGAAGDMINRIMHGASTLPDLARQAKDKIKEVIDKALGKAAETIIIGASIAVAAAKAIDKVDIGRRTGEERTTLYRAVGLNEAQDIESCQCFQAGGRSMEGKWFATTYEDAIRWGRQMQGAFKKDARPFRIAHASVPQTFIASIVPEGLGTVQEMLDGIGPAYYIYPEGLPVLTAEAAGTIVVDPQVWEVPT